MMTKRLLALLLALTILPLGGCGGSVPAQTSEGPHKLKVVTTLFPLYDFARQIAGDTAEVTLLLPPGIEPHAYDPTPRDVVRIREADLFIYTSPEMEPWVQRILQGVQKEKTLVVEASQGIRLMEHAHDSEGARTPSSEAEKPGAKDPHVWLDPVLAARIAHTIEAALIQNDPARKEQYTRNAEALDAQLNQLDADFKAVFAKTRFKTIIYGGHFAFGYFAERYGLDNISPYKGFSPDAEPTPARIAQLIETLKSTGQDTIYFEELIDPKIARVISEQTGAQMLLLHGAHNLSKEELSSGITYVQIMEGNLERLKKGLKYHE